jgi:hypothetical protein
MDIADGITFSGIIDNYLLEFKDNMSIKDVVYKVVKDNLINKKALRNKCIVQDFDAAVKKNSRSIISIYDDLAYKYNLSYAMIRGIVAQR